MLELNIHKAYMHWHRIFLGLIIKYIESHKDKMMKMDLMYFNININNLYRQSLRITCRNALRHVITRVPPINYVPFFKCALRHVKILTF